MRNDNNISYFRLSVFLSLSLSLCACVLSLARMCMCVCVRLSMPKSAQCARLEIIENNQICRQQPQSLQKLQPQ